MAPSPDPRSVWRLRPGHPDHAGLAPVDVNDFDRLKPFDGTPMAAGWAPFAAFWDKESGLPIPDVASIVVPALTERGLDELGDLIEGRAEPLPLEVAEGPRAWLLNVTHLSDALDEEASEVKRFRSGRFMKATRYAFDADALAGHTIFKLRQTPESNVLVTGEVVARLQERGLTGADLREVWTPGAAA